MIEIASENISKLDLSNMNLTEFPTEILNLKNLRKLNLSNNKLSVIPREIEKLKNLELLDLFNNNINPLCILNNAYFNIVNVSTKYKLVDILNSC